MPDLTGRQRAAAEALGLTVRVAVATPGEPGSDASVVVAVNAYGDLLLSVHDDEHDTASVALPHDAARQLRDTLTLWMEGR